MTPPKVAKTLARILGVLLILLGIAGFVPNALIGATGYIPSDTILNCMHVLFGFLLLTFTTKGESTAATGLYTVGMLASAVAIIGYVGIDGSASGPTLLFDTIQFTQTNVFFAGGMAVLLVVCGTMNTSSRQLIRD